MRCVIALALLAAATPAQAQVKVTVRAQGVCPTCTVPAYAAPAQPFVYAAPWATYSPGYAWYYYQLQQPVLLEAPPAVRVEVPLGWSVRRGLFGRVVVRPW